ncbi:MAG: hypothetical protein FWG70_05500 [Oscillospiraceae bacterium]|nr:hypothetical protein [Oscillospiraceae bacterium]
MNIMNESKKTASIEYILEQGLQKPQKMQTRIAEMARALSFRYIFWDIGYSIFFTAVTVLTVLLMFVFSSADYRYSATVAVAPLLYLLITAFVETSERACGLYEIKQTCRYTIRQITAIRVVCYSLVGAGFTAVIAVMGAENAYEFAAMFPLCLSALFACAALSLIAIRFIKSKWAVAVFSIVWLLASVALPLSHNEVWENFLGHVPITVSIITAIVSIALFFFQVSKMLSEVKTYAFAQ